MAEIRPGAASDIDRVYDATVYLRMALREAKNADCPRLALAIRKAIKSADGARRHAAHRAARSNVATNRSGDMAAAYAEETGIDYSTALVHCNMD